VPLEFNNGIRVLGTELWLDATRTRDISFVSHAHYDHATRHRRVIASAKTALLYRHRVLKGSRGTRTEVVGYEFGDPFRLGDLVLTLFPSGHILGASQILIETDKRIVYTGDFKVQQGLASERIEILPCDVLIMECTYRRTVTRKRSRPRCVRVQSRQVSGGDANTRGGWFRHAGP